MPFVFRRETGAPLFDTEERPVPRSLVRRPPPPSPAPFTPPQYARLSVTTDELGGITPEHDASAKRILARTSG